MAKTATVAKEVPTVEPPPVPDDGPERLVLAARDALTDSMVERLSIAGANAMEIVDRLNEDDTRDAIHNALDRLTELHRIGALDTLFDLVTFMHASRAASTDSIVERLSTFAEQMVNVFGSDHLSRLADGTAEAMEDAVQETKDIEPSGGIFATISMMSKPETQKSMLFLLKFAENLRKRCCE